MLSSLFTTLAVLGLTALTSALPANIPHDTNVTQPETFSISSFSCTSPVSGLSASDCSYMSQIGMAGQGQNARSNNGGIWVGTGGANTFQFFNRASVAIILVLWDAPAGDYQSSFMNVRKPKVSWSLAAGGSVTVSLANGVSGGWSALYNHKTTLSQYGQVYNTWGEFTTGNYATVDISREINMGGNTMDAKVSTGCTSNMNTCAFVCKSGNTCGASGSYNLIGCTGKNAASGTANGNPSGGCQGWSNGGHIDASFY